MATAAISHEVAEASSSAVMGSADDGFLDDKDTDDDYSTGVTWWGISACIVGGASFISLFAYFLVCRRIQSRSRSEDFQSHVATAADAPLGEESRPSRQGPGRSAAPASGTRRGSDFRQPLMHDNDEAQDMLMRSRVLFASEHPKQQRPEAEP